MALDQLGSGLESTLTEKAKKMQKVLDETKNVQKKERLDFPEQLENQSLVAMVIDEAVKNSTSTVILDERNYDSPAKSISLVRVVADYQPDVDGKTKQKALRKSAHSFLLQFTQKIHQYNTINDKRYEVVFFFDGPLEGKVLKEESNESHPYQQSGRWVQNANDSPLWMFQGYSPNDNADSPFGVVVEDHAKKYIVGVLRGSSTLPATFLKSAKKNASEESQYLDTFLVKAYRFRRFNCRTKKGRAKATDKFSQQDRKATEYIFEILNHSAQEQPDRQIVGIYVSNGLETERLGEGYEVAKTQKRNVVSLMIRFCPYLGFQ